MQGNVTMIVVGVLVLLVVSPLLAALVSMAASAVLEIVPGLLIVWFVLAILHGMVKNLFR